MKRIYTKAQLQKKANARAARQRKKERAKNAHPTIGNKIYTARIISPRQCLDSINSVLEEKKYRMTKFGDTHIIIEKLDKKDYEELATAIHKCRVTTEHGRIFKPIICGEKYKDVTPKKKHEKKPSNNTKTVKIAAKNNRKFSNVKRNTNRLKNKTSRRIAKFISLVERRNNCRITVKAA